jgi:UDP-N-acetylglucosamine:LPS N-acetylglucosamine transferase
MRYILTGGGSGGHIYPLISFAKVVKTLDPDATFLFVGKKDKMESKIAPRAGLPFKAISTTGTKGKISFQNAKAAIMVSAGFLQAKKIIKDFQPDICIGAGGYVSVPLMLAANNTKSVITAVLETDQFMGRANLQLARKSDFVFAGTFDLRERYFKNSANYHHVGHPRGEELFQQFHTEIATKKRSTSVKTVTFIGGSLGAQTINEQAIAFCKYLATLKDYEQIQVILVAGTRYYEQFKHYKGQYQNLHIMAYCEDMPKLYLETDILVCRSGAGVLAEAATFMLPTIAIPSPNVMNDHQTKNADYFVKSEALLKLSEKEIADNNDACVQLILNLMNDSDKRNKLIKQIEALAYTNAVSNMYNILLKAKN